MARRHAALRAGVRVFAAIGVALTLGLAVGTVHDVRSFDRTRGGYAPPYDDYTGTPIDWSRLDVTPTGMARRGHVVNVLLDCTSGRIAFEVFGLRIPFRRVSARAIAVHAPRAACRARGFAPRF